jgi:hypothetical protein
MPAAHLMHSDWAFNQHIVQLQSHDAAGMREIGTRWYQCASFPEAKLTSSGLCRQGCH